MQSIEIFLQFIAIIIAINALITGIFVWLIDKDRKILKNNVKNLKSHVEYTESVNDALIEWIMVQEKKCNIEQGLIYKFMSQSHDASYENNFRNNINKINLELHRREQELMLHSNIKYRRESAYKQLSHAYGNIESYDLMKKIATIRPKDRKKYNHYLKALKEKLKEN